MQINYTTQATTTTTPTGTSTAGQTTKLLRKQKNQLSARLSRQRRLARVLQLELSLKDAHERIRQLEAELCFARAESIVTSGCMLTQALVDPIEMGIYEGDE